MSITYHLLQKNRNTFFTDIEDETKENLTAIIKGTAASTGTWPELLFTTNVAIVGLELDYSEIDLWWLLAQRAAIFASFRQLARFENSITYYYVDRSPMKNSSSFRGRMHALEALGVYVQPVSADDYPSGYKKIAEKIKKLWNN